MPKTFITPEWCERMAKLENDSEIGAGAIDHPLRMVPMSDPRECLHYAVTQDKVTGEVTCNQCGKLLIDSIGRVLT